MSLYVTRAALEVNGQTITDFKAVAEKSRTIRKQVPLMYKTGHAEITQRFVVEVDYVVPQSTVFDFDTVSNGTLTIEYDSGTRVAYGGVYTLEAGDAAIDGENELIRKITLGAETRNGLTGASV
jgi:hypothetical protein